MSLPRYEHLWKSDAEVDELPEVKRDYPQLMFTAMLRKYGEQGWRVVQCAPPEAGSIQPTWWILFEREML